MIKLTGDGDQQKTALNINKRSLSYHLFHVSQLQKSFDIFVDRKWTYLICISQAVRIEKSTLCSGGGGHTTITYPPTTFLEPLSLSLNKSTLSGLRQVLVILVTFLRLRTLTTDWPTFRWKICHYQDKQQ